MSRLASLPAGLADVPQNRTGTEACGHRRPNPQPNGNSAAPLFFLWRAAGVVGMRGGFYAVGPADNFPTLVGFE